MKYSSRASVHPLHVSPRDLSPRYGWRRSISLGVCMSVLWLWLTGWGWAQEQNGVVNESFTRNGKSASFSMHEDAVSEKDEEQRRVAMNFQDVDIPVLARFVSELTRKNFIMNISSQLVLPLLMLKQRSTMQEQTNGTKY